ncbi:hypothetical protein EIP91_001466 [Steccherinum ochraceum]|uniref:Cytochrome P450 n=1 Tax=Steccherinum ochraceum TaxID=92696 RepID=A0A4R0RDX2_9APHY|nr:hypothetical protein EIP91_001466 [Steccherinum ochraceum]
MSAVAILFVFIIFCALYLRGTRRHINHPPGPKPLPFIGNILDMPSSHPWETYREWRKTYSSDIIYLDLPLQPTIVLNSFEAATDLLERRSGIYSDRIKSVVVEMLTWDFSFGFMPYGAKWRTHRRMFHQWFYQSSVKTYCQPQLEHARVFLGLVLKSPGDTRKHIRFLVTATIFAITYGRKILDMDDEYVIAASKSIEGINQAAIPGRFWVEYMPFLRRIPSWVPGTYSRRFAEEHIPYVKGSVDKPYLETKEAMDQGTASPSLAVTLINYVKSRYGDTKDEAQYDETARNVLAIAYAAAADTTTAALESFLLAMALHPDVQRKAQAELDAVVGPSRLPEFEDLEGMPYIQAVLMEVLRWMPVTPIAIPHVTIADDEYQGYHIRKGTTVIACTWTMTRDPEVYPNPDRFLPERFLRGDGTINPDVRDPTTLAFGFGRR